MPAAKQDAEHGEPGIVEFGVGVAEAEASDVTGKQKKSKGKPSQFKDTD